MVTLFLTNGSHYKNMVMGFGSVLEYGYGYGLWLSISLNGIDSYLFSLWVGYGYIKTKVRFIGLDSIGKFLVLILVWLWLSISMDGIDYCSLWLLLSISMD